MRFAWRNSVKRSSIRGIGALVQNLLHARHVLVAAARQVDDDDRVLRELPGDREHVRDRMRGFERRQDALKPRELLKRLERFSVSGISEGKPKRLEMATLLGEQGATELKYEFKYFQLFNGTLYLPEGFAAGAIQARMLNDDGEAADKEITWEAAKKAAGEIAG